MFNLLFASCVKFTNVHQLLCCNEHVFVCKAACYCFAAGDAAASNGAAAIANTPP